MQTIIAWTSGSGNITLTYTGHGSGTIVVTSDDNDTDEQRSQTITIKAGSLARTVTIIQEAGPNFKDKNGNVIILSDDKAFNVKE